MIEKRNIDTILKRILEEEKNSKSYRDFVDKASGFRKNLSLVALRIQNRILEKDMMFVCGSVSGFMTKKVDEAVIFSGSSFGYYSENYRKNAAIVKYCDIAEIRVEGNVMTVATNFEERFKVVSEYVKFYETMLREIVLLESSLYSKKQEEIENSKPHTEDEFIVAAAPVVKKDPVVDPAANYEAISQKKAGASEMLRAMKLHSVILIITSQDVSLNPRSEVQTKLLRLDGVMRAYDETLVKHGVIGTTYEPLIKICEDSKSTFFSYLRHKEDLVQFAEYLDECGIKYYKKLMVDGKMTDIREYVKTPDVARVSGMLNEWGISTKDTYTLTLKKNLFAKTSENEDELEYKTIDLNTGAIVTRELPEKIMENEYYYDVLCTAENAMERGFEVEITDVNGVSVFENNPEVSLVVTSGSIGDEPEVYRQFFVLKNAPGEAPERLEVKVRNFGSNENAVINYVSRGFNIDYLTVKTWIEEGKEPLVLKLDQTIMLDRFVTGNGGSIVINDGEYNVNDLLNPKATTNKFIRITNPDRY